LIGTAIATALLPTLSEHIAAGERQTFKDTVERSLRVMVALSLPIAVILSLGSLPLIQTAFGFSLDESQMILWATQGYLIGLLGHSVVEVGVRSFYADKNAKVPMLVSGLGLLVYIGLALLLVGPLESGGIALANSISYSIQGVILIIILSRRLPERFRLGGSFLRGTLGALAAGLCVWLVCFVIPIPLSGLMLSLVGVTLGAVVGVMPIWREVRMLVHL
jgi:putative peptidoglycan lipid II flippase